jgi:hypothetical protein
VTGSSPPPLLVVERAEHTLYLARYNNTFVKPSVEYVAEKLQWVINATTPPPRDVVEGILNIEKHAGISLKAVFNGTDWVAATAQSITPLAYGNKTWLSAVAINTWFDFPYTDFNSFGQYKYEGGVRALSAILAISTATPICRQ